MTDSFTMGGLVNRYEIPDAAIKAIDAGVDLILLKDENALRSEVYHGLLEAARRGALSEARIQASVRRVLTAKARIGLLDGDQGIVDLERVNERLFDPEHALVVTEAAEKSVIVLRQQPGVLPIQPGARVLVVEQVSSVMRRLNDPTAYPGALYHALLARGINATYTDFEASSFDKAWGVVQKRAADADRVVHTGFYERSDADARDLHARFLTLGKPTVFVTNNPYELIVSPQMPTVVVTFSSFAASMTAAAQVLCGQLAAGPLNFDPTRLWK